MMISGLISHLWQSTLFTICAAVLALALRRNRVGVRYFIWLTAPRKFLVPFALLVRAGGQVPTVARSVVLPNSNQPRP